MSGESKRMISVCLEEISRGEIVKTLKHMNKGEKFDTLRKGS